MINPDIIENVIYKEGQAGIQTHCYKDARGIERVAYSGCLNGLKEDMTVPEYLAKPDNAGFLCVPFDYALERIRQRESEIYLTGWTEISAEQWDDALTVLPPRKWKTENDVEIFMMSEMTTGTITGCYARHGDRYFCGYRRVYDSYGIIADEIKDLRAKGAA